MIRSCETDVLKRIPVKNIQHETIHIEWMYDETRAIASQATANPNDLPLNCGGLLQLNDHCLDAVCLNSNWRVLHELTKVCTRTSAIATKVAHSRRTIEITDTDRMYTPLWKAEEYLRQFGSSIQTIHIKHECAHTLAQFVSRYCNNIRELNIHLCVEDSASELSPLFSRLRKLRLTMSGGLVLEPNSLLESLHISMSSGIILPGVHAPNLVELDLDGQLGPSRAVEAFLRSNPQIERLTIRQVSDISLRHISTHLRDLLVLIINEKDNEYPNERYPREWDLTQLHTLHMNLCTAAFINFVCREVTRYDDYQLKYFSLTNSKEDFSTSLVAQMTSVEHMCIDRVNDDNMIRIASRCTRLITLEVIAPKMTLQGVRDVLHVSTRLTEATFKIPLKFDPDMMKGVSVFDEIAELRQKRSIELTVEFSIFSYRKGSLEVCGFF